jgi:hypothetical protein
MIPEWMRTPIDLRGLSEAELAEVIPMEKRQQEILKSVGSRCDDPDDPGGPSTKSDPE